MFLDSNPDGLGGCVLGRKSRLEDLDSLTVIDLGYIESRERKYRFTMLQYSKRERSDQL